MLIAKITLSSKGQIVIPKEIRDELHWQAGMQLSLISTSHGVSLRSVPTQSGRDLSDLIGMLKHEGLPVPTEVLCQPVEIKED